MSGKYDVVEFGECFGSLFWICNWLLYVVLVIGLVFYKWF